MPVPTVATYSAVVLTAAHTAVMTVIDSGTGPGYINVRDALDVLLAKFMLTDPCGAVNSTTGRLTFTVAGAATWFAAGTAAYGEICDSTGAVHAAMPCAAGTVAVPGCLVLNTLTLLGSGPLAITSAVMG